MFQDLDLHIALKNSVYVELLIALSPMPHMPATDTSRSQCMHAAGFFGETRDATTEIVDGAGMDNEYGQGVRYA